MWHTLSDDFARKRVGDKRPLEHHAVSIQPTRVSAIQNIRPGGSKVSDKSIKEISNHRLAPSTESVYMDHWGQFIKSEGEFGNNNSKLDKVLAYLYTKHKTEKWKSLR